MVSAEVPRRRGRANVVAFAPRASEYVAVDVSRTSPAECRRQLADIETPLVEVGITVAEPEAALDRLAGPVDPFLCRYVLELVPTLVPENDLDQRYACLLLERR